MNVVCLVGNLAADPKTYTTGNGTVYTRFKVACQRTFKNADGKYDADFIDCIAWRKTAELVERYFHKGSRIGVRGEITTGSYTDKNGEKKYTTDVTVNNVEFVGPKQESAPRPAPAQSASTVPGDFSADIDTSFQPLDESELPF